jgi:hypothetical protein
MKINRCCLWPEHNHNIRVLDDTKWTIERRHGVWPQSRHPIFPPLISSITFPLTPFAFNLLPIYNRLSINREQNSHDKSAEKRGGCPLRIGR